MFQSILRPATFAVRPSCLSLLGLQSKRCFSTINPRVYKNAVFMPELFPAKLTVPATQEIKYDFTCENQTTVGDFCQ